MFLDHDAGEGIHAIGGRNTGCVSTRQPIGVIQPTASPPRYFSTRHHRPVALTAAARSTVFNGD
jgi:hypothetical protein